MLTITQDQIDKAEQIAKQHYIKWHNNNWNSITILYLVIWLFGYLILGYVMRKMKKEKLSFVLSGTYEELNHLIALLGCIEHQIETHSPSVWVQSEGVSLITDLSLSKKT